MSVPTVESAAAENGTARLTIQDMLAEARSHLVRLRPAEAEAAVREGALLVDPRSQDHRLKEGTIHGSVHMSLSVLEWRVDPDSGCQNPAIESFDDHIVLICREEYSSSLAARRLQRLGFWCATDVIGDSHVCRSANSRTEALRGAGRVLGAPE